MPIMTPKEKAKKLVERFYKADEVDIPTGLMEIELARQCALICVDELLQYIKRINESSEIFLNDKQWQEVKTEIEKL